MCSRVCVCARVYMGVMIGMQELMEKKLDKNCQKLVKTAVQSVASFICMQL